MKFIRADSRSEGSTCNISLMSMFSFLDHTVHTVSQKTRQRQNCIIPVTAV